MNIKEAFDLIQQVSHQASWDAGWWHDLKTGEEIPLTSEVKGMKLALVHSEISEALEGDRKNLMDDKLPHRTMIEVELADAIIRIGDLAGRLGLDVGGAIEEKLQFNKNRPDHQIENRKLDGGKSY